MRYVHEGYPDNRNAVKPEARASGFDRINVSFSAFNVLFARINDLFSLKTHSLSLCCLV